MGFSTKDFTNVAYITSGNSNLYITDDIDTVIFSQKSTNSVLRVNVSDSMYTKQTLTVILEEPNQSNTTLYYPIVAFYKDSGWDYVRMRGNLKAGTKLTFFRHSPTGTWYCRQENTGYTRRITGSFYVQTTTYETLNDIAGSLSTGKISGLSNFVNSAIGNGAELQLNFRKWDTDYPSGTVYSVFDDGFISIQSNWNNNRWDNTRIYNRHSSTLYISVIESASNADWWAHTSIGTNSYYTIIDVSTSNEFYVKAMDENGTIWGNYLVSFFWHNSIKPRIINVSPLQSY